MGKKPRKHTPIISDVERGAMGVAYAAKKGEIPVSKLRGPSKEMFKNMPKEELKRHLKESKGKDLPHRVIQFSKRKPGGGFSTATRRK